MGKQAVKCTRCGLKSNTQNFVELVNLVSFLLGGMVGIRFLLGDWTWKYLKFQAPKAIIFQLWVKHPKSVKCQGTARSEDEGEGEGHCMFTDWLSWALTECLGTIQ